jgi:hypothetical protein
MRGHGLIVGFFALSLGLCLGCGGEDPADPSGGDPTAADRGIADATDVVLFESFVQQMQNVKSLTQWLYVKDKSHYNMDVLTPSIMIRASANDTVKISAQTGAFFGADFAHVFYGFVIDVKEVGAQANWRRLVINRGELGTAEQTADASKPKPLDRPHVLVPMGVVINPRSGLLQASKPDDTSDEFGLGDLTNEFRNHDMIYLIKAFPVFNDIPYKSDDGWVGWYKFQINATCNDTACQ